MTPMLKARLFKANDSVTSWPF